MAVFWVCPRCGISNIIGDCSRITGKPEVIRTYLASRLLGISGVERFVMDTYEAAWDSSSTAQKEF
jgi:hypothetical protein